MRLRKTRTMLACGLLGGAGVVGTQAAFSDTVTVADNGFKAGTLDLTASPSTAVFDVTNMAPGDVEYRSINVTNSGTLPLAYTLAATATNADAKDLRSALTAEVKVVVGTCSAVTFAASVTTAAPAVTGIHTLATSAARSLAAGGAELLCFKVGLPSSAGNALQGAATTATFTFGAS